MGPHESFHFLKHLFDVRHIGCDRGETEEGALAEVLVIELSRRHTVTVAGGVEEAAKHLSFVLQAGCAGQMQLNGEQGGRHSSMISALAVPLGREYSEARTLPSFPAVYIFSEVAAQRLLLGGREWSCLAGRIS
jgi:hypothetical protein